MNVCCGWQTPPKGSLDFEAEVGRSRRQSDWVKGRSRQQPKKDSNPGIASIPMSGVTDGTMHEVYIRYSEKEPVTGGIQYIQYNSK